MLINTNKKKRGSFFQNSKFAECEKKPFHISRIVREIVAGVFLYNPIYIHGKVPHP